MFNIQDEKRAQLKIFSESQSFYDLGVKNQKFKKPMLTFSIFLLLLNLAEIKITGTSIGLISGTIMYPAVIPNAIFILTLYYTILYVVFMQFLKETKVPSLGAATYADFEKNINEAIVGHWKVDEKPYQLKFIGSLEKQTPFEGGFKNLSTFKRPTE